MKNIIYFSVILLFCTTNQIFSQQKEEMVIRQDFVPLLDSLIVPPADCREAKNLVVQDTTNNEYSLISTLDNQDKRIQALTDLINNYINGNKMNRAQDSYSPTGNVPDQRGNIPHGDFRRNNGFDSGPEFKDIREDMQDANVSMDRMVVIKEKFKNELTELQSSVNERLHKTLKTDYPSHVDIINDFMKSASGLYKQYHFEFRNNMKQIDDIIKRYDYGSKFRSYPLSTAILKFQLTEADDIRFLLNITKEFAFLGAKFYDEAR